MTFNDKKQIILSYMDADISESIPSIPAFIPGVGQSPNLKAHADDTFRMIARTFGKPGMESLVNGMINQLQIILNNHLVIQK